MLFVRDFMMCSSIPCTARGVGGCVVVVVGGGAAACAAPRGAAEAKDAGSRRVHPLPGPCSQLGG